MHLIDFNAVFNSLFVHGIRKPEGNKIGQAFLVLVYDVLSQMPHAWLCYSLLLLDFPHCI
jgi:hypothetical protein